MDLTLSEDPIVLWFIPPRTPPDSQREEPKEKNPLVPGREQEKDDQPKTDQSLLHKKGQLNRKML